MRRAGSHLIGLHDFTSFCRRAKATPNATLVRRLLHAEWVEEPAAHGVPPMLRFEIAASAFCHQMVRSIVGALVDVGRGRFEPADVRDILIAQDRSLMNNIAPPHGLFLWQVGYPDDPTPAWNGAPPV
jgi:tRNA pseudouridine38-40 synthase